MHPSIVTNIKMRRDAGASGIAGQDVDEFPEIVGIVYPCLMGFKLARAVKPSVIRYVRKGKKSTRSPHLCVCTRQFSDYQMLSYYTQLVTRKGLTSQESRAATEVECVCSSNEANSVGDSYTGYRQYDFEEHRSSLCEIKKFRSLLRREMRISIRAA